MVESNKTEEFLQKLAPCIERGELEACVEEAARVAGEMGIGAEELLKLSAQAGMAGEYVRAYVLTLAAAHGLSGKERAGAYSNAGAAAQHLKKSEIAEKYYNKAIVANPKFAGVHNNYANLLREKGMFSEAEKEVRIALQVEPNNPYALGTYGDILAYEDYLEEAIEKYHEAIKNSGLMVSVALAEIRNNLGWVYAHLEQYNRAKKEFEEAHKLDPSNVKAIRNLRALRKVKSEPKITRIQICLAFGLLIIVIATWYLFLNKMVSENVFAAQSTILIAILIFILFYHQLSKFKAGPIEFEKSTEHRSQPAETLSKIER